MQIQPNITLEQVIDRVRALPPEALPVLYDFADYLAQLRIVNRLVSPPPAQVWPEGFFEETFGSLPDLADRPEQGEPDLREALS